MISPSPKTLPGDVLTGVGGDAQLNRKFDRSVSMLAWGYNEELLVEGFLSRATALLDQTIEDWELVFINDGSVDRTGELADAFARNEPRVRVIHNPKNVNVGQSARRAIKAASKDLLFWQTVDWSYDISELRRLLELTRHMDVVVGVRPYPIRPLAYVPIIRSIFRIKTRSDNLYSAFVSLGNYYLLRILFSPAFHDYQNVHFHSVRTVQSMSLNGNSSFLAPEILFRSYERGLTFIEAPIPFIPRTVGTAKGASVRSICRSILDIFRNWLRWGLHMRIKMYRSPGPRRVFRLIEAQYLPEPVLHLMVPFFRYYRPDRE